MDAAHPHADETLSQRLRRSAAGRVLEVFSNEKNFARHPVIGSRAANRLGLHIARVKLAEWCASVRRNGQSTIDAELSARMQRDGILVLEDVLPPQTYEAARAEFRAALATQAQRVPVPPAKARGFGKRHLNAWGFDRFDGGSLNRFVDLDPQCPTLRAAFDSTSHLAGLLRSLCGTPVTLDRFLIYSLIHGPEAKRPDLQRQLHCDTFHETFKLWYFFDEVDLARGPLMFAPGSHRNTMQRLMWERRQILSGASSSASFRISEDELSALGWQLPQPVVTRANSLVLANTRGIHCRSVAQAGMERACLYANLRPRAFALTAG